MRERAAQAIERLVVLFRYGHRDDPSLAADVIDDDGIYRRLIPYKFDRVESVRTAVQNALSQVKC